MNENKKLLAELDLLKELCISRFEALTPPQARPEFEQWRDSFRMAYKDESLRPQAEEAQRKMLAAVKKHQ